MKKQLTAFVTLVGLMVALGSQSITVARSLAAPTDPWKLGGNIGTTPGTDFVGTIDNTALQLHVNGKRALRLEPNSISPNIISGNASNNVTIGASATIVGGGGTSGAPNRVTDNYGTVGGV